MQSTSRDADIQQFLPSALTSQLITADFSILKQLPEIRHADGQQYNYNNEGHRGPDFIENVDMLTVGCSVTYGVGLPIESTWSYKLAKDLGLSYNVLSFPGGGISLMVRQVFEYINKYGAPKYLIALLPDSGRIDDYGMADTYNFKYTNRKKVEEKLRSVELSAITSDDNIITKKDRPINLEFIKVNAISQTILLIRLCKFLGINLLWGTWSSWDVFADLNYDFFSVDDYILKTRSTVSDVKFDYIKLAKCHEDPTDPYWVEGSDRVKHYGTHYHVHVAEHFRQELIKLYGTKS